MTVYLPNPMRYSRYMTGMPPYGMPMYQPQSPIAAAINNMTQAMIDPRSGAETAEANLRNEQARGEKMKNDALSQFGNVVGDLLKQQPGENPDQHAQRLSAGLAQFAPMMGPQAMTALRTGLSTANAYGSPDDMRRALVLDGKNPGENFAGTSAEANSVAARNNALTTQREIAVKNVPGAAKPVAITPALAGQFDQMVDHNAPGVDPATKALILQSAAQSYQSNPNAVTAVQGAINNAGTVTPAVPHWYGDTPATFTPKAPAPQPVTPQPALTIPKAAPAAPPDNAAVPGPVVTGTPQENDPTSAGASFTVPPLSQRKAGGVYATPSGYRTWSGTGWSPNVVSPGDVQ